jgi:hypothetical protein
MTDETTIILAQAEKWNLTRTVEFRDRNRSERVVAGLDPVTKIPD